MTLEAVEQARAFAREDEEHRPLVVDTSLPRDIAQAAETLAQRGRARQAHAEGAGEVADPDGLSCRQDEERTHLRERKVDIAPRFRGRGGDLAQLASE